MNKQLETKETVTRLIGLFNKVFDGELAAADITPESRLVEDLGMNSIALLYMAIAVEEEFGVKFTNEDFTNLRSVADVVAKVEAK